MSPVAITRSLTDFLGADTHVTVDDDVHPTALEFYRSDPLSMDLVREALARTTARYPSEMSAITAVYVAFDGSLGISRRRVVG